MTSLAIGLSITALRSRVVVAEDPPDDPPIRTGTNVLAEEGTFSDPSCWEVSAGLAVSSGELRTLTVLGTASASLAEACRAVIYPGEVLSLSFTTTGLAVLGRLQIALRAYDADGVALQAEVEVFDTADGDGWTAGLNTKAAVYFAPAGAATLAVIVRISGAAVTAQIDDLKLVVQ